MKRFVIATVIAIKGSAPREVGAKILISADETLGTIGGGTLEYQVMHTAREFLDSNKASGFNHQQNYILGTEMGQCCGGQVEISYQLTDDAELWQDPLQTTAQQFNIVLFGAGHVGQALVSMLATQPCQVHWVDSRSELFPTVLPSNVIQYAPDTPASLVNEMLADSYFLVMTHDHALDLDICDHVLARNDVRFLGLIGSATKAARFRSQLLRRGLEQQTIDRLTCPIGIGGIGSKLPSSIAVAVVAQLVGLQEKWQGLNTHLSSPISIMSRQKDKSPLSPLLQRGEPSSKNKFLLEGFPLSKRWNKGDLSNQKHQDSTT